MLEVTVKRSKWLRGDPERSELRREDTGEMCCLGFVCRRAGYRVKDITGITVPSDLADLAGVKRAIVSLVEDGRWQKFDDTAISTQMMSVNDRRWMKGGEAKREARLVELGKKAGIAFTFVD